MHCSINLEKILHMHLSKMVGALHKPKDMLV